MKYFIYACVLLCIIMSFFSACQTGESAIANLGLNRAAYQSDYKGYIHMAHLVTDGQKETGWVSPLIDNEWIYVDLGREYTINKIVIFWGENYGKEYTLLISGDKETWDVFFHQKNGTGKRESIIFSGKTGRYIKFQGIKGSPNPGFMINEMEIYGEEKKEGPVTLLPSDHTYEGGRLYLDKRWTLIASDRVKTQGTHHSKPGFNDTSWLPAIVPGTVLTTYVARGAVPDPYYGNQQFFISDDMARKSYWYRTEFFPPADFSDKTVWLQFDGINYMADIFVNGNRAGEMKGAFIRGCFDITPFVKFHDTNGLAVLIYPVEHPGTPSIQDLQTPGANGGDITEDTPTFVSSAGWDWMPTVRDRNIGIWQPVSLHTSGPVTIHDPFVITDLDLPDTSSADLTVKAMVKNSSPQEQQGTLVGRIGDIVFEQDITLPGNTEREIIFTTETFPQLTIADPLLWWPNTYGDQHLYTLELGFIQADGIPSHGVTSKFGVREFSYDFPHELLMSVNGVPVFIKGGNWGIDEGMKRTDPSRLRAIMRLHKEGNFTMIRNWAGQTTQEDFYSLCDEYGFLVWNDFWLVNTSDGPEPNDDTLFINNARDTILRYRIHPSIAVWCGRNETLPPPALDTELKQALAELDGTRHYFSCSDRDGVHGHGPYTYVDPKDYFRIDAAGFSTEIGLPSIPEIESIGEMLPAEYLWPINDMWGVHDFTNGNAKAYRFSGAINTRYGKAESLVDFNKKARLLMMENYRAIFESWASQFPGKTGGVLLWMTHPAWPSFIFQLYDYYLNPSAAYFGAKKGCEPLHILWNSDTDTVHLVNTTSDSFSGLRANAVIYSLNGKKAGERERVVESAPHTSGLLFDLPVPDALSDVHFIKLTLASTQGELLADNFYWRSYDGKDFTQLKSLPPVTLTGRGVIDDGTIILTLENQTDSVALMARVKVTERDKDVRILPVFYSDNYISLLPGETRTITIDGIPEGGDTIPDPGDVRLFIDGWNIEPGEIMIE